MDASSSLLHQKLDRLQVRLLKRYNHADPLKDGSALSYKCKKRRGKETLEEERQASDKWKNMDPNILGEIFRHIPIVDLFVSVSSVCQSWEVTCWDFMFWSHKVLDMSATGAGFGMVKMSTVELLYPPQPNRAPGFFGKLDSQEKYNDMAVTLMRKLRRILEGETPYWSSIQSWRVSLATVILPYDLEVSDRHLLYIAERTPRVQYLFLLCPSKVTAGGFIKALQCWNHLRGIHLGPIKDESFAQFIDAIGAYCKEIESLHIHQDGFRLDKTSAVRIAHSLPGLKKLELELGLIKPSGITTLYNMCPQFEEVYFNGCGREDDIEYEQPRFDSFRLTWTLGEFGCPKWHVTPCIYVLERIDDCFRRDIRLMKYLSSPQYLENKKAKLEPEVETWMLHAIVAPIPRGEQP